MRYATIDEIAVSWGISTRQVHSYCTSGRSALKLPKKLYMSLKNFKIIYYHTFFVKCAYC